jgi:GT2 family glycosyltransferase/glycosyltransferase involved in cell wall biosynthesis
MSSPTVTVVVPTVGRGRLDRMLASLAAQTADHQAIVVDNGSDDGTVAAQCATYDGVEVLRLADNAGYSRACNLGAERGDGEVLVLLNDDCVCDPGFVAAIAAPIDAAAGVAMAAGVMRDWADPGLIDSAGMELDRTLLVYDYLNGEPVSRLERGVASPIGPSGAAAAFDRRAFLDAGGFDERLFAYWEDVDLVLRLRRQGYRCELAPGALGVHEHSATLGSGSARKNYLMGFGRGYVLRKWRVLSAGRLAGVLVRDGVLCAGQALVDRNVAGIRGRVDGYRAARPAEPYPAELERAPQATALANLRRRLRRRARLRRRPPAADSLRSLAVFHLGHTSGPSRSLEAELAWLASEGSLDVVLPGPGEVEGALGGVAEVIRHDFEAVMAPSRVRGGPLGDAVRLLADVRGFRRIMRDRRPDLVVVVTSMLPAASIAAAIERLPTLVYCGELFDRGYGIGPIRALAGRQLAALTGRLADAIVACSNVVARQFARAPETPVEVVYPPVSERYGTGDGAGFRELHAIAPGAPLIAAAGYLTEGRGQDVLIRALPAVLESAPEARLVIAGDPFPRPQDLAFRQYLTGLIAQLRLQPVVELCGFVDEIADVYAAADVIVNPARVNEAFGRVPFEAAVAGCPAVVTRVGAVPELLRDGDSALIVAPDDPAELATAILRVLGDEALAARLAAGARRIVDDRLTPQRSLAGFRRAVETTLGRPLRAPEAAAVRAPRRPAAPSG